ncbi:hypothetical protein [Haloactinomyces albus]|uniref:Uncharacterized protein n=1 Tax=Haloactinomyces albus TaxID=1352928 RepID=A0AAE4CM02_9ACTN|nr:hypothetical protein [Haloactinomyces albus]MDR7302785.1 hypothetical protein [Haloactinomyces albus]
MAFDFRALFTAPRDGTDPAVPSEVACEVCGHHALEEATPHEYATGLSDRLVCGVCGAHHIGTV